MNIDGREFRYPNSQDDGPGYPNPATGGYDYHCYPHHGVFMMECMID